MRTIWNGSISFGLVNIPIGLALATQRSDVAFRTLHRECGTPIKQKRWCPLHEREVEADDVRSKSEIEEAVEATEVKKAELALAGQVIESLVGEWDAAEFENEYRRDLKAMLEAKLAGQEITRPEPTPETPVVDLMEALRRSVQDVQGRRSAGGGSKKTKSAPARRKTAATRKSA